MAKSKNSRRRDHRTAGDRPNPSARAGRDRLWLYGNHAVEAALANPARVKHRLVVTGELAPEIAAGLTGDIAPEVMDRREVDRLLPPGAVHQGMALLASPLTDISLEEICAAVGEEAVLVILDQANDPRNIGAVLRSAAAFGADAVIVPDRHTPEATAVLAKAASGALDKVPFVRVNNLARAMDQLKEAGFWFTGLDADVEQTLAEANLKGKTALVLGAEGTGLRRLTKETCDFLVRIPIDPDSESLNLSAAAAITLYEIRRLTS